MSLCKCDPELYCELQHLAVSDSDVYNTLFYTIPFNAPPCYRNGILMGHDHVHSIINRQCYMHIVCM